MKNRYESIITIQTDSKTNKDHKFILKKIVLEFIQHFNNNVSKLGDWPLDLKEIPTTKISTIRLYATKALEPGESIEQVRNRVEMFMNEELDYEFDIKYDIEFSEIYIDKNEMNYLEIARELRANHNVDSRISDELLYECYCVFQTDIDIALFNINSFLNSNQNENVESTIRKAIIDSRGSLSRLELNN